MVAIPRHLGVLMFGLGRICEECWLVTPTWLPRKLSQNLRICLSVCLFVCLSVFCLSVWSHVCFPLFLSVLRLSLCVCQSVSLAVCLPVSTPRTIPIFCDVGGLGCFSWVWAGALWTSSCSSGRPAKAGGFWSRSSVRILTT